MRASRGARPCQSNLNQALGTVLAVRNTIVDFVPMVTVFVLASHMAVVVAVVVGTMIAVVRGWAGPLWTGLGLRDLGCSVHSADLESMACCMKNPAQLHVDWKP